MLCGLYELDITPPLGVNIPGYFESRPAEGIRDNLYARALACENAAGGTHKKRKTKDGINPSFLHPAVNLPQGFFHCLCALPCR